MPTSTMPIKIDKITTIDFSIGHSEAEITLDAIPLSAHTAEHNDSSRIQYIGRFLENKTQFEGKRIHHTTEHCLTYTGMFMISTDSDGNTLFKPPEEPSIATLKKETPNDETVSITHFGYFVNLTPFGNGIETKKTIDNKGTHCLTKKGNFVDINIQGPYKQTLVTFTTKDNVPYHVTTSCQFEKEPLPDDEPIYGETQRSIVTLDSHKNQEQCSVVSYKGKFTYLKNLTRNITHNQQEWIISQGEVTKTYHDGTVLTSEGSFIFKDNLTLLDNSLTPHIKSSKNVSIEKEIFQHSEGVFRKNILTAGFFLTRFNDNTDNLLSCYEGKFDLHENTDDPDGILCHYNYANQKFIAIHGFGRSRLRNTWFDIKLNNSNQIVSIAALTSKSLCNAELTAKKSSAGTVITCIAFTTPTTAKTLWTMHRDALGQWTRLKANSTKTPSIEPEQITLWNRLEKIAIFMKIAHPFIAQPLLEKPKNPQKESVAAKAAEAAAESARDLLLSEISKKTKNKTSKMSQPKPSVASKQNLSINLSAIDNSELNDIDIEISTILTTSSDTISTPPQKPIHYPTPIGQEKRPSSLLPGEVRTPFMNPPTPTPFWADA